MDDATMGAAELAGVLLIEIEIFISASGRVRRRYKSFCAATRRLRRKRPERKQAEFLLASLIP